MMTLPSELPWGWGHRRHPWLYAAIAYVNTGPETPVTMRRVIGEYPTEEAAAEAAQKYKEQGYYNTADVGVDAPTEEPKVYKTAKEAVAAAELIPITLYTVDCPVCGQDVMSDGEYSCSEASYVLDYLHQHMEDCHPELPYEEDEDE